VVLFGVVLLVLPFVAAAGWYWIEPWFERIGMSREKRALLLVLAAFVYGVLLYGYQSKLESDHQHALGVQRKTVLGDLLNPPFLQLRMVGGNMGAVFGVVNSRSNYPAFNVGVTVEKIEADEHMLIYDNQDIGEIRPGGSSREAVQVPIHNNETHKLKATIRTRSGVYYQRIWLIKKGDGSWTGALIVTDDSGKTLLEDAYPGFPRNDNGEIEWFD